MLSQKAATDFKLLWKKEFGEDLSEEKAQEEGEKLLRLFNIIYKPIVKEWAEKNQRKIGT